MKRRFKLVVIAAVLFLLLGSALLIRAQQTNKLLVIEGARLIDGTGRPPIENAVIVIADDTIQQVFKKGERVYSQDARIIQAEGKTVIPALFDIDTHIGQQGLEAAAQALSNITGRYVELLADRGLEGACNKQPALLGGVNTRDGKLTIQAVAEAHGLPYTPTFSTEALGSLGG